MREDDSVIEGRNVVTEAFRSGRSIDKLFVQKGLKEGRIQTIIREARKQGTVIDFLPKERLDEMSSTGKHQGVIAYIAAYTYV